MGILDDAIREHLELKRMHGASEEELRLQEVEALGSPRREPDDADSTDLAVAEEGDADAPLAPAEEPVAGEPPAPDADPPHSQELESEPDLEPEPLAGRAGAGAGAGAGADRSGPTRSRAGSSPLTNARSFPRSPPRRVPTTGTCWRTRPTSFKRRRSTTGSGSSRSRRATSISTRRTI